MATINNFEDLDTWKRARELNKEIYSIITGTNLKNDYKLKEQINGSSGSIMDNIAEGFERGGNKEFNNFLSIAKASCGETRSQLYRVHDRKYITKERFEQLRDDTIVISRKLGAFMIYLQNNEFRGNKFK